ncbi:hypothetical protein LTR99_004820 [Exophiala xenobiotica]|uniref:Uncharacterized protein n=1 Tax=Vermiconidia calcicola TaxID=1690605 RepID=A0AAV9QF97_9PEZI|nr:hypothetical protein LTR96_008894 [Exophiala xenobiotica]KAK5540100.1 hypothetical protein LTR25_003805 [Vermiconidia calcicola]KAK5543191.1 hypothetical protein LTR23_004954 [Chaetothyriales sp. CCFEE 6169]KAK5304364.1 hypothetical protein LTR99_004820 [Exophiala xenobiotica]KAK5338972.1 hypothetical protein LTR98_005372 [Exophiala xenobiotica]
MVSVFKFTVVLFALFLSASVAFAAPTADSSRSEILAGIEQDPNGFIHFADDGIVRSYSANGTVIDYAPLSNKHLLEVVNASRPILEEHYEHLMEVFNGVDGHNVTDLNQIWDPPEWLRPQPDEFNTHQSTARSEAAREPAALLNARPRPRPDQPMCYGMTCTTGPRCRSFGCQGCGRIDALRAKICYY